MNSDWKSALSGLLPEGHTPESIPAPQKETPKQNAPIRIELDRKRAGKTATIISGFTIGEDAVASLARQIKQHLGTGGSSRGGEILIQGDKRAAVDNYLKAKGYKTKVI